MNTRTLYVASAVVLGVIAAIELLINKEPNATLLVTLTYFTMMIQGCVAVVATAIAAKGIWIIPVRRDLLAVHPLLLVMSIMFLLMSAKMELYPWITGEHVWLEKNFFLARNAILMLLCWVIARPMSNAIMAGNDALRSKLAIMYLMVFVGSQSLIAFDWLMSLEYPWINTLFGPFFFIQAFLQGLIVIAFIIFFRTRSGKDPALIKTLTDAAKMIFSFSFMWGGFMFCQYLVIWYGNIPEEVYPILKRVSPEPFWGWSRVVLTLLFFVPFLALLSRKIKFVPAAVMGLGAIILVGQLLEILLVVLPVVGVNYIFLGVEFVLMFGLVAMALRARDGIMPEEAPEPLLEGKSAHATAH